MFVEETVFVIGAGASWHYGYPTGEELIARMIAWADILSDPVLADGLNDPFSIFIQFQGWREMIRQMDDLRQKLVASNPLLLASKTILLISKDLLLTVMTQILYH